MSWYVFIARAVLLMILAYEYCTVPCFSHQSISLRLRLPVRDAFYRTRDVLLIFLAYEYCIVPYHALVINQSARSTRTVSYRTCRKSCQCSYCTKRVQIPYRTVLNMMSAVLNTRTVRLQILFVSGWVGGGA